MLQMINPNGQATLAGQGGEALPAGFAQAQGAQGDAPAFDLQLALRGFVAADATLPAADAANASGQVAVSEPDAEQWLLSMLDQQAVRVEAREGAPAAEEGDTQAAQAEDPDGAVLAMLPVVDQQPELPARQPEAPVLMRQALPSAANAVQALPMPTLDAPAMASLLPVGSVEEGLDSSLLERLPVPASDADAAPPATGTSTHATTQPLAAERTLKLHAPQAQWGEQMLQSLREHVDLQINQRIQNATIRLDPPELGSLEIYLSHESGRLSVQLSAANADVARLLQQTSDRLRQELVGQNFVQVNVQVSADAQGGRQQGQAPRQAWFGEEPVQAASATADAAGRGNQDSASDVLVTV